MKVHIKTLSSGLDNLIWEYWDGSAWKSLAVSDGSNRFSQTRSVLTWTVPSDWRPTTPEHNTLKPSDTKLYYYIRARTTDTSFTAPLLYNSFVKNTYSNWMRAKISQAPATAPTIKSVRVSTGRASSPGLNTSKNLEIRNTQGEFNSDSNSEIIGKDLKVIGNVWKGVGTVTIDCYWGPMADIEIRDNVFTKRDGSSVIPTYKRCV